MGYAVVAWCWITSEVRPPVGPVESRSRDWGAKVDEAYGFESVQAVSSDPFPPGVDPETVRLPPVPRFRSPDDDEAHHRDYWQAHVWVLLHRYRRTFADPACPPALRGDYPGVADQALRLVERATGAHPISPMDSVACHSALKDLRTGVSALEDTVVALHGASDGPDAGSPDGAGSPVVAAGVHDHDFFASGAPARPYEFRLSLRGTKGLRRR